ncbi:MAG: hypothetical protein DRQ44_17665 [Gammaproteobacteria bacterium]|nr:MAG: hypothetical protein DRQ44_17665 [Gammaproteobacteria bacterium]
MPKNICFHNTTIGRFRLWLYTLEGSSINCLCPLRDLKRVAARLTTQQMHASGRALRGFTASPDSALHFLDRPMLITVGRASKARLDSELAVKPEGTSD